MRIALSIRETGNSLILFTVEANRTLTLSN